MIREATVKDAARIAEIEVNSSRFAYKNVVSDECLFNDLNVDSRIPVYTNWIEQKRFELYVYEDHDTGIIKGMMGIGKCEDEDKTDAFELHFIYLDPEFVRNGIGSEMLGFFEGKGKDRGFSEFVIWVLDKNAMGISFYEKHGYRPDGKDKIFKRWGTREIRYVKSISES